MYIYVLTRITKNEGLYGSSVPNLGVYTNRKKALDHFDLVKNDRIRNKSEHHWTINERDDRGPRKIIKATYLTLPDGSKEELMIERWKV